MRGQKSCQIGLGHAHHASKPMRNQMAGPDPPANSTGGDVETLCYLGDCEESNLIAPATAAFPIFGAERHHRSPPYSEVERTGLPIFNSAKVLRSGGA
jgi:hypothetical protein